MQTISAGYQSLSLLINLNWDRIMYVAAIGGALWLGSVVTQIVL
ncbi:hypothetical protein [Marivivens niveibacter]|nr:hypothetical protein [Marivivens niveibacter]